jgi:hypothetical protein
VDRSRELGSFFLYWQIMDLHRPKIPAEMLGLLEPLPTFRRLIRGLVLGNLAPRRRTTPGSRYRSVARCTTELSTTSTT